MAKHSEEYKAPHGAAAPAGYQELFKTLQGQPKSPLPGY